MKKNVTLLGVPFENLTGTEARRRIAGYLQAHSGAKLFTPNPQILWQAHRDPSLTALLRSADLLLPDGVGLTLAARLSGTPLSARLPGIDVGEWILGLAAKRGLRVYFLGGRPGVARDAARRMTAKHPGLRVVGTHHGYFEKTGRENDRVLAHIRARRPHILFVCFGFPAQERWITAHASSLPSLRLCMGLGGSLDVWSGRVPRAPRALQALGLEWLWRALREPKRLRGLVCLPMFLGQVIGDARNAGNV